MTQVTIIDIAKKLNISPSTVSRALRDHPGISNKTKLIVKKLAKGMKYHPNSIAQNLKTNQSSTIGVIVPSIQYYFFSQVISGIEHVAYDAGFTVMVFQSNEDFEREVLNVKSMLSHRIAGMLISVSQNTNNVSHLKDVQKRKIPLVIFDRDVPQLKSCKVLVDDFEGAFKVTEYLIKKGYKKIAHITGNEHLSICKYRLEGYMAALKKYKLPVRKEWIINTGLNEEAGMIACGRLLNQRVHPDAIVCATDPIAIGVYNRMHTLKLRIPEDMAVTGFSNILYSHLISPSLTTLDQPAYEIGVQSATMLIDMIKTKVIPAKPIVKVLKMRLIIRESS